MSSQGGAKVVNDELAENRKKLADKIGNTRTGGNTARRKHKQVNKTQVIIQQKIFLILQINDDKKLKQVIKKYGVQSFQGVDEVNFFKDDNSIMHFSKPDVHANIQSNTVAVFGNSETKSFKELMPDILQHIGPNQFNLLKDILGAKADHGQKVEQIQEADEEEDIPDLVGKNQNFEEVSNK